MDHHAISPAVRIGHVHLMVADLDRSLAFYRDLLGFHITGYLPPHPPHQIVFLAAGESHHDLALNTFLSRGGSPPPPGHTGLFHVAFLYPTRADMADAVRRVHAAGITFRDQRGEPLTWPMVAFDHLASIACYMHDPDGITVELAWDKPREQWGYTDDGMLRVENWVRDVREALPELDTMTAQGSPTKQPTKQELLALLRNSGDEVITTVRALPPEALTRVCYTDGWTGREVVAHLASIEWTYPRLIDLAKQAAATPTAERNEAERTGAIAASGSIDDYNARQVAKRADASLDQLLDEFARNRAATIAAVKATDDALLAVPVRTTVGLEGPLGAVMRFVAVEHVRGHLRDLTAGG